jgi:excisionase family DNA binding protein
VTTPDKTASTGLEQLHNSDWKRLFAERYGRSPVNRREWEAFRRQAMRAARGTRPAAPNVDAEQVPACSPAASPNDEVMSTAKQADVAFTAPIAVQTPPVDQVPVLLTIREACMYLRVSRSTVDRMLAAGTMPGARKVGGQWRFHRQSIERWVMRGEPGSHALTALDKA